MTPPIAIAGIWREAIPATKTRIDKTKKHDRHGTVSGGVWVFLQTSWQPTGACPSQSYSPIQKCGPILFLKAKILRLAKMTKKFRIWHFSMNTIYFYCSSKLFPLFFFDKIYVNIRNNAPNPIGYRSAFYLPICGQLL